MDLLNRRKNDQKKIVSLAAIEIKAFDELKAGVAQAALILPGRCVVTGISLLVETDHNGEDLTIETIVDGAADGVINEVLTLSSAGYLESTLAAPVPTTTGMKLAVTASADFTTGSVLILVNYMEPTLASGALTAVA